jgi:type I restriction enzyme S subunit
MSVAPYSNYKDSGIEWLGRVPKHWDVIRVAHMFREVAEAGTDGLPILSVSIHDGVSDDELGAEELDRNVARSDDKSMYKRVEPGDLVYNMMRAWQGGFGSVRVAGMVSPAYVVARPRFDFSTSFIEHLLRTPNAIAEMRRQSRGVTDFRLRLYWDRFKDIHVALPPFGEQAAIVAFLERETGKIDALVEEQTKLIELLNETVISFVNFNSAKQVRIEHVACIITRPVIQKEGEVYIPLGLFNRGRGLFHKDAREMKDMGASEFFRIEEGGLIISGQFAWEGAIALAGKEEAGCVVSHRYPVLRGKANVALTEYLYAILATRHGNFLLNENSRGAAGRNRPLNIRTLLKEKIALPDLETQQQVGQAVHRKNALVREIAMQIKLLNERRAALISAVVTGKIDVCELAGAGAAIPGVVAA